MSHYTIDYAGLSEDAKRSQAIEDIKQYLGSERFNLINAELIKAKAAGMTEQEMGMALTFAGISGYPVAAWYESL